MSETEPGGATRSPDAMRYAGGLLAVAVVTGVGQEAQWRLGRALTRRLAAAGDIPKTFLMVAFILAVGALIAWVGGLPWVAARARWGRCLLPALAAGIASTLAVDYTLLLPLTTKYGKLAVELGSNIAIRTVAFGLLAMLVAWVWAAVRRRSERKRIGAGAGNAPDERCGLS